MSEFIYLLQCPITSYIKIGKTSQKNPYQRISSIQTSNPSLLTIIKIFETPEGTENRLHNVFHKYRKYREWFDSSCLDLVLAELSVYPEYVRSKTIEKSSKQTKIDQNAELLNEELTRGYGPVGTYIRYGMSIDPKATKEEKSEFLKSLLMTMYSFDREQKYSRDIIKLFSEDLLYGDFLLLVYAGYPVRELQEFCQSRIRDIKDFPIYIEWEMVKSNPLFSSLAVMLLTIYRDLEILNSDPEAMKLISRLIQTPFKEGNTLT
jgi:hypothetical protein